MNIPTDLKILKAIYSDYYADFCEYNSKAAPRETKIYVPIDCKKIAESLSVDVDIIFGRLYYHLEYKYGYKRDDGSSVHLFVRKIGSDFDCINFPLMSSVLANLLMEKRKFWTATTISVLSLLVSLISISISFFM